MKIVYHNDADGKCAGFWVKELAYAEEYIGYIEMDYGREFPFDKIKKMKQYILLITQSNQVKWISFSKSRRMLLGLTTIFQLLKSIKTTIKKFVVLGMTE